MAVWAWVDRTVVGRGGQIGDPSQLLLCSQLEGEELSLDIVAQLLEPVIKLGLCDAQLGVAGRTIAEWQCDSLELVDQLGGQLFQVAERTAVCVGAATGNVQPWGHVPRTVSLMILGQVCHLGTDEQQREPVLDKAMAESITYWGLGRLFLQNWGQERRRRAVGHGRFGTGVSAARGRERISFCGPPLRQTDDGRGRGRIHLFLLRG